MQNQYLQYSNAAPTVRLFAYDSTTGLPVTSLTFSTVTVKIRRDNGTKTTLTLVTATAGTWVANGFVSTGDGEYDLYLPTSANASGAKTLQVIASGTGVLFNPVLVTLGAGDISAADATDATIAAAVAPAVRTNLATELARLDAPISGAVTAAVLTPALTTLRQALSVGARFGGAATGGTQVAVPVYDAGNSAVLLGTVTIFRDADKNVVGQSALTPP